MPTKILNVMEIIIIKNTRRGHRRFQFGIWGAAGALAVTSVAIIAAYHVGVSQISAPQDPRPDLYAAAWQQAVAVQQSEVENSIARSEENLNALALRLGEMQSQLIRLDAVGQRMVEVAKLDSEEFGFGSPPAVGGSQVDSEGGRNEVPDFVAELEKLSASLKDRSDKLQAIQSTLVDRKLQSAVQPRGKPIKSGWLSSFFGHRADPFTGKRAWHAGIDFAGKKNSDVVAVAAGVVRWSGNKHGYGKIVEVDHGNGVTTRYAHNNKNLVKIGDTVKKGQTIALMGSTGHSTGFHVHFEILENGKPVDPLKFVRAEKN